jgi:hypothetical protein
MKPIIYFIRMKRVIIFILFISLLSFSCKQLKNNKTLLPHVTGAMNDVLLVMSTKNWESEPGEEIREVLLQSVPAIPQDEKKFDIVWMPHEAFTHAVQKQRNIIITKIGPDYKSKISYYVSLWAQSQLVIQIMAPNQEEFIKLMIENGDALVNRLENAELERLMSSYNKSQESSIRKNLNAQYKIDLIVPKGYTINLQTDNFIWLDNRYRNTIEGILIYFYPYTDSNTFTTSYLVEKRNANLKKYIPGEKEGSYPVTETKFPIVSKEYELNGKRYTYEMRGLWKVVDGFAMGGPFMSITQFDEINQRIVTVDGFIFAPGEEKRKLIKHLEAILYSLNFINPDSK